MRIARGDFEIDDDWERQDKAFLVEAILNSYWGEFLDEAQLLRSFENSVAFGIYEQGGPQVGCARVVTDFTRFAWLSDVYVDPAFQGQGLGRWLMDTIVSYDDFRQVSRWVLATKDAHALYAEFGFERADPDRMMTMTPFARPESSE
ncbi:MAG: GNAT family N-acetyltransferase [Pseudomonadota bacterium]